MRLKASNASAGVFPTIYDANIGDPTSGVGNKSSHVIHCEVQAPTPFPLHHSWQSDSSTGETSGGGMYSLLRVEVPPLPRKGTV